MTERYALLIKAIADTDKFIMQMFIFAALATLAYPVLDWLPIFFRRPAKIIYLAFMLAAFVFVTVYSWQL